MLSLIHIYPKHNDRQFNIDNSDHIDLERAKRNVYWDCYNGIRSASVTGREDEIVDSFEEVEQLFYKIHYQDYVCLLYTSQSAGNPA